MPLAIMLAGAGAVASGRMLTVVSHASAPTCDDVHFTARHPRAFRTGFAFDEVPQYAVGQLALTFPPLPSVPTGEIPKVS